MSRQLCIGLIMTPAGEFGKYIGHKWDLDFYVSDLFNARGGHLSHFIILLCSEHKAAIGDGQPAN